MNQYWWCLCTTPPGGPQIRLAGGVRHNLQDRLSQNGEGTGRGDGSVYGGTANRYDHAMLVHLLQLQGYRNSAQVTR